MRLKRNFPSAFLLTAALACALLSVAPAAAQTGSAQITGTVLYEKILTTGGTLQLDTPEPRPASGVKIEVISLAAKQVIGDGMTDEAGRFQVSVPLDGPANLYIRALAQGENARVVPIRGDQTYSTRSAEFRVAPGETARQDLLARDSDRSSGPFNIIVAVNRANAFLRHSAANLSFPEVTIRWATDYSGGTRFSSDEREIFLMGARGRDSDEFDDTVINHEYAHFLAASFSRDDSPGGNHSFSERLDPRLAWDEGFADFFGCVSNGTSVYIDTGTVVRNGRRTQGNLRLFDLEENSRPEGNPGYWNEHTVASALWDLYDDQDDEGDTVSLGFAPLWRAFVALKNESHVYFIDFCDVLVRLNQPLGGSVASILAVRSISYSPGHVPSVPNPFPQPLPYEQTLTGSVDSFTTRRQNLYNSSAFYTLNVETARTVTITLSITNSPRRNNADLDLYLWDSRGTMLAHSFETNGVGDGETIRQALQPGTYLVEVRSWSNLGFNVGDFALKASATAK